MLNFECRTKYHDLLMGNNFWTWLKCSHGPCFIKSKPLTIRCPLEKWKTILWCQITWESEHNYYLQISTAHLLASDRKKAPNLLKCVTSYDLGRSLENHNDNLKQSKRSRVPLQVRFFICSLKLSHIKFGIKWIKVCKSIINCGVMVFHIIITSYSIGTHGTTSLNGSAGLFEAAEVANGGHNNSSNPNKPTSQHYDTATKIGDFYYCTYLFYGWNPNGYCSNKTAIPLL